MPDTNARFFLHDGDDIVPYDSYQAFVNDIEPFVAREAGVFVSDARGGRYKLQEVRQVQFPWRRIVCLVPVVDRPEA